MPAYNRQDMLGSMRVSMAAESAPTKGDEGKSAVDTTTASGEPGEKAESGTPGDGQGGDEGAAENESGGDEAGSLTDSEGTTAEDGEGTPSEEQAPEGEGEDDEKAEGDDPEADKTPAPAAGKWEEEEQKALDAWLGEASKKLPNTPEVKKLLKIAKDNQAAVQVHQQEVARHTGFLAEVGNALVSHDIENLNAMVESLGGDKLPFDLRDETARIKEITESWNLFYDPIAAALKDDPETLGKVNKALQPAYSKVEKDVNALERKVAIGQEVDAKLGKEGKKPVKGQYLKDLETKADRNYTLLVQADPAAKKNLELLKPLFKKGTVFQNFAKVYAQDPETINKIGAAVDFMENFKKDYLPAIRQSLIAELKLKRGLKAPPTGKKGDTPGAGDPPAKASPQRNFNHFAGSRLLQKHGGGR